jgi:hypothetical protein
MLSILAVTNTDPTASWRANLDTFDNLSHHKMFPVRIKEARRRSLVRLGGPKFRYSKLGWQNYKVDKPAFCHILTRGL